MIVSKAKYNCLKTMTDDLMRAEYFINSLGVETRTNLDGDTFRNTVDVLEDIITVCNNNPTILDDCAKFLAGNPTTSDESDEFLNKYNLKDIYKVGVDLAEDNISSYEIGDIFLTDLEKFEKLFNEIGIKYQINIHAKDVKELEIYTEYLYRNHKNEVNNNVSIVFDANDKFMYFEGMSK